MKVDNVSYKVIRQIAWDYANNTYLTMEKIGEEYGYTRKFVSKLLSHAIEENIVSDNLARKIMERAISNTRTHAGEEGCARVREAFERSFLKRKKRIAEIQKVDSRHKEAVQLFVTVDKTTGDERKYVEPKTEQLSMFSFL